MKIQVTTRACGRLSFRPGDVIELTTQDALALIDAGAAKPVQTRPNAPPPVVEQQDEPETKARRRKR